MDRLTSGLLQAKQMPDALRRLEEDCRQFKASLNYTVNTEEKNNAQPLKLLPAKELAVFHISVQRAEHLPHSPPTSCQGQRLHSLGVQIVILSWEFCS